MSLSEQRPLSRTQEPSLDAQAMARMPAWKREILERRRAKQASPAADGRSWDRARATAHSGWAQVPSREPESEEGGGGSTVLLESIAPVQENPFIKRERRRRRLEEREPGGGVTPGPASAHSIPQLLEMYSHIPGVRTIRANNIIIIESDPDYFAEVSSSPRHDHSPGSKLLPQDGEVSVAQIRAAEVFIYEAPLSRSEENLSTLSSEVTSGHLHGKVSRLLEKFDQNYVKPARSRSTENLLDGFSAKDRQSKPLLLPKPLILSKHNQGPVHPETPSKSGSSVLSEAPRSPGPELDSASPSQPKSSPLFSFTRRSVQLSPDRTSSLSHVALNEQGSTTTSEDRPYSVSSYRKQFEGLHTDGCQKDSLQRKIPSHRSNENLSKDSTDKGNNELENGHPQDDFIGNDVSSVKEAETDSEHQANSSDIGNSHVPSPLKAFSVEVFKEADKWRPKYEVDPRKSKSCPEVHPSADDGLLSSSVNPSATPLGKVKQIHTVNELAKVTPNQCNSVSASTSLNNSFEIVPATPPDFASIPEDDIQARALANLKKQSKNSFVVIPKKRSGVYVAHSDVYESREMNNKSDEEPKPVISASIPIEIQTDIISQLSQERISPSNCDGSKEEKLTDAKPLLSKAAFEMKETLNKSTAKGSYDVSSGHINAEDTLSTLPTSWEEAEQDDESSVILIRKDDLPVTNIDDILVIDETNKQPTIGKSLLKKDKPPSESFGGLHHPFMQRKSGNTFTVVPQRKQANSDHEATVNENEILHANGTEEQPVADLQPSLAKLGVLLKKRYPAAEEIQVIGGYLSLERSCLSKSGSTRKKMKISFNESNLHTTFEYPSENSLIQEEESEVSEDEDEQQTVMTFLPRPSYISSPTSASSPIRTNTAVSALSSYTPKHTMPFDSWQEQKQNKTFPDRNSSMQSTEPTTEDNVLTPVDSSCHSDYSSEPALYF
ncbi:taperin [Narcine bancroftii]|uniref:taperin n=1 Tax=Narcine bancroftii TaxID=1343680 RepID=UPI0038314E23